MKTSTKKKFKLDDITVVIYHRDMDGLTAAWAVWKRLQKRERRTTVSGLTGIDPKTKFDAEVALASEEVWGITEVLKC